MDTDKHGWDNLQDRGPIREEFQILEASIGEYGGSPLTALKIRNYLFIKRLD